MNNLDAPLGRVTAKFGGTSMGTAESIAAVAEIVESRGIAVAVVSATSGTTDQLLRLAAAAVAGEEWESEFEGLVERHEGIMRELGVEAGDADAAHLKGKGTIRCASGLEYEELRQVLSGVAMLRELSLSLKDRIVGFGERMSSHILAAVLRGKGMESEAVNAYELVFCDNTYEAGEVDFEKTNAAVQERLGEMLERGVVPVVTGFIGQSEEGKYITLGRGGSDYTGAIMAAALGSSELQIWTDVDGIFNTDPRLVPEAHVLEEMSFGEAGELAYFGAKVIHPKTIQPAIVEDIPVRILNTFNPDAVGTLIRSGDSDGLKSVTYKKGISIINICSSKLLNARGFLARIFEVFARHGISVDVVSTSEVSVSVTLDIEVPEEVVRDLEEFSTVTVMEEMAIVCLVGDGIRGSRGLLGQLFSAVNEHDVQMVSVGASKRNVTFLVSEGEAQDVVKKVFNQFFS